MDYLVGNQRFITVGNITPTGQPIRIFYISAHSTISGSSLTLHNGLVSSTDATVYQIFPTNDQGDIHHEWYAGVLYPDGVWLDTDAAGKITTLIGYSTVKA